MKRLKARPTTAILLAGILAFLTLGEVSAALQIYKVKGNVTIKKGKQNVKAQRRDAVAKSDLLTIPKEGKAEILDTETRRIYSSKESGNMTVKTLMDKAANQASDITRNINRKVMAAVADNAANDRKAYEAMGMAIHETDAVVGPPVMIPEGTTYLSYLIANTADPDRLHQCNTSLRLSPIDTEDEDGAFSFTLNNSTGKPLYFNIIEKGEGKGLQLLLPQNPLAAPREETTAGEFSFIPDPATKGYIAIASDKDFTADDVWHLLDPTYEAQDVYYLTVLSVE